MSNKPSDKKFALKKYVVIFITVFSLVASMYSVSAEDKCKNITDLDEKAKCYEKEYQSVSKKLSDVLSQKNNISKKISNLASQLTVTQAEINELNSEIKSVQAILVEIDKNLEDRKNKLGDKINVRNQLIRNYSKNLQMNEVELFLSKSANSFGFSGFELAYVSAAFNKAVSSEFIKIIQGLNAEIQGFEKDRADAEQLKKDLTSEQTKLLSIKVNLDAQKNQANSDLKNLNEKEKSYSQKLAELSAKQQEILKLKSGDENGSVGDRDTPSSRTPDPPFRPAFAAFSYGAYTHYNGMSQYGAKGRAEDGQDYKQILKFYYKTGVKEEDDLMDEITVQGHGEMDFQKYLYGIAEMPSDWPDDALKAQAIAARTYAYRYTSNGDKSICTTQSCQVFLKSKSDNPPSKWKKAVDDTEDVILDNPSNSQYSSTTGGYINNVGWDAKDGVNGWKNGKAYEKSSPWFYKAWYTKSYNSSDSCGHPHPWLSEKEMADILNSWVVWRKGSGSDKDHISPVTESCWGGDPYSLDEMASKADDYGEKYTSVSGIDVDISTNGYTSKVKLTTNKGTVEISGEEFKTVYNLRAPGYISIKSRLYDMEKR
jgi:peptidoglycan hydrolase-like amidase/peptidoglycan hydrolase CwlO-like protein